LKILFITNHYPPSTHAGGYAQLCEEVADGLFARGHAVEVLASASGGKVTHSYPVHRLLPIDPDWHSSRPGAWQFFVGRRQRERRAVACLWRVAAEFRPSVVFIWHTLGLPRVLLQESERLPNVATAYYLADYVLESPDEYIDYWKQPPVHWTAKLLKRPLSKLALYALSREGKPVPLSCENVICVSEYIRRRLVSQALISTDAVVIHNGVDLERFSVHARDGHETPAKGLRCLVAGRVVPEKGIHTVVEALALLQTTAQLDGISMTILGSGPENYCRQLRDAVAESHLQGVVEFHSPIPREQMPQVLAKHDVLILPSEYDEPLARSMQEAMAMGVLVVGTTTGGSGELLVHEETGLVFEPRNPESLAAQLVRAMQEPPLVATLAESGRRAVVRAFDIQRTVENVECYLTGLVECR
jgi:glycogen(starch) synthase